MYCGLPEAGSPRGGVRVGPWSDYPCARDATEDDDAPTDHESDGEDSPPFAPHTARVLSFAPAILVPPPPLSPPDRASSYTGLPLPRPPPSPSAHSAGYSPSSPVVVLPPPALSPMGVLRPAPIASVVGPPIDPPDLILNACEPHPIHVVRSQSQLPQPDWSALTIQRRSSTPTVLQRGCVLPLCAVREGANCISHDTMAQVLRGQYNYFFQSLHILDCRFPYEFEGGHIRGAVNVTGDMLEVEKHLRTMFFPPCSPGLGASMPCSNVAQHTAIIFHCEFSQSRGPTSLEMLRNIDARITDNASNTSFSGSVHTYEQVYLLQGGFKEFFAHHPDLCDPQGYVPMESELFKEELRACRRRTLRKSLSRSGTQFPAGGRSRPLSFNAGDSTSQMSPRAVSSGPSTPGSSPIMPVLSTLMASAYATPPSSPRMPHLARQSPRRTPKLVRTRSFGSPSSPRSPKRL